MSEEPTVCYVPTEHIRISKGVLQPQQVIDGELQEEKGEEDVYTIINFDDKVIVALTPENLAVLELGIEASKKTI